MTIVKDLNVEQPCPNCGGALHREDPLSSILICEDCEAKFVAVRLF